MNSPIESRGYAVPGVLVDTDWVAAHTSDPSVRIVESNEDTLLYPSGHLAGSVQIDWTRDLNDQIRRDYLDRAGFDALCSRNGISPETRVVFYGDKNNWWACYAFWVFQLFNHTRAMVMDGGRLKWERERRLLTREVPQYARTSYAAGERNDRVHRAFRGDVLAHLEVKGQLVDVRSPEEFSGERMHMPGYPNEGALRGGHIPGAKSIPWPRAINTDDGSFKTAQELKRIYLDEQGLEPSRETLAYCRIGERSSHTWFVLKYLLGFKNVRNYDGSWTEWGNLVGVPVERP